MKEEKTNPNELANEKLRAMPSLAGREPRSAHVVSMVVLEDLKPCKTTRPAEKPIEGGAGFDLRLMSVL